MQTPDATPWSGELTSIRHDERTGATIVVAIHSTRLGPAGGGTRAAVHPSTASAVAEARRLAAAMTAKMAIAGLPMGGGKAVIALPAPRAELDPATWEAVLAVHAETLELLRGSYATGPDLGTTPADMDVLRRHSRHVFGCSTGPDGPSAKADATALGVVAAIRSVTGRDDLAGLRVLVQGQGAVGTELAHLLGRAGAALTVCDVDASRCAPAAERYGAAVVAPDAATTTACDVFAPCAVGGVLDVATASALPCSAVAGAANAQLAETAAADVLHRRGIVFAPEDVAGAGGAIHLVGREVLGWSREEVRGRTLGIRDTLDEVLARAAADAVTPVEAARRLAELRLAEPVGA